MKNAAWWRMAAVFALLTACGPSSNPAAHVGSATPSAAGIRSPGVTPSAVPVPGTCDAVHHCLALVTLRGSDQVVVRDVTNIDHPVSVTRVPDLEPKFISATELSYADANALYRTPLSGSPKTVVANAALDLGLFAWSSDGTTAGYMTGDGLHLVKAGLNRPLGEPLPHASAYGCESQVCADSWDSRLAFSPDGKVISLLVQSGPVTGFRLWSSDGVLMSTPAAQAPTMSVWSGSTLYFSDVKGVEAWHEGVTSLAVGGVSWIRPKASPAGGQIVYAARDRAGLAHVYLFNTLTKKARELKSGRREPVFLTARYLWYAGEQTCAASDPCPTGPTFPTGKTYIYDLQTGTEYESIITNVYDAWPHAA